MPANRIPTHLKIISGTAKPYRINAAEPKPQRGIPSPPKSLTKGARAVWREISAIVADMGILTLADAIALETLCECVSELRAHRAALAESGEAVFSRTDPKTGDVMHRAHPRTMLIADADRRLRNWLAAFGLTPADRSRVSTMAGDTDSNPFANLG